MPFFKIAIFILALTLANPTQAGPLTRGNILAESFAGCSVGIALGIITSLIFIEEPVAATVPHLSIIGYCSIGSAITVAIHSLMEFSYFTQEYFDPHGTLDTRIPMVYPITPGRIY
ncbi:hypothetical protein TI05_18345 [Achromatium sp. WMS3]|nr:hypothetical protein TI05_18345 [Achromatium sp. WMS3]